MWGDYLGRTFRGYSRDAEVVSCTSVAAGGVAAGSKVCGARQKSIAAT